MNTSDIYSHVDRLSELNGAGSLNQKLGLLHHAIRKEFGFIERVAVALYEKKSNLLKTFLASMDKENPLIRYDASFDDAPGLREVLKMRRPRVVNDLALFDKGDHTHTKRIREQGFAASYTFPFYNREIFTGFIFFNASRQRCFSPETLDHLDVFAHLIAEIVIAELNLVSTMVAALKTAHQMVHFRDPETGNHLERMSRFARLVARELAKKGLYPLDDETIERIFVFAPMHDIGKIAIPDHVLLKPARLTDEEIRLMKTHTTRGRQMIDILIKNFGLESLDQVDMLRHIVEYHHETLDGRGYPHGLEDRKIPIEARIITVADIFDALTSERPYKPAWTNDDAFDALMRMARTKLDEDCINVLIEHRKVVEEIQERFKDGPSGEEGAVSMIC